MGRSFRLSPAQQFWKILLPAALPTIFVGMRLGLIFALINVVGVEFLINFGGLGQLINDLAERYDLPAMYATIGFVILVSVVFFMSLERIERWLRPGQKPREGAIPRQAVLVTPWSCSRAGVVGAARPLRPAVRGRRAKALGDRPGTG